ncbi:MAG: phage tail tape measure protein, partial [Bacilli bacterium]
MKNIEAKINIDSSQLKSAFTGIDNLSAKLKNAFAPQKVVVDTGDATKEIDELKKSIGSMQSELMRMAKSGGKGSEEYVALQAKIKGARGELKLLADNSEKVGNSLFNAGKKGSTAFGFLADTFKVAGGQLLANVITSIGSAASAAVTEFVEFDKQVKNIGTLGVKNFEEFSGLLTELSRTVPETTAGLAAAAYDAISAGIQGTNEEIVKFVESAAKVGVAGLATTQEAVNGLSSVLNAYGLKASDVNQVSDTFFATIKLGKTTFGEMNASLSNVIPTASAAGIKFDEVGAAISQMTALGTPTAQATTQIRQAIIELGKPTGALKEYFDKLGISGKDMTEKLKSQGLIATL